MNKLNGLIIAIIMLIISTTIVSAENVTLQKTIVTPSVDNITVNSTVQFLINLTNNNATDNITNMTIVDIYNYSHLTYVGSTIVPYQNVSGQITWNITYLANLSSYLIEVNFTALTNVSDTNNAASLRNISAIEIANSSIFFNISEMPDTTFPNVTLNSPNDTTNSTTSTITFNATISDNKNITNVTLYGNWSGSWVANETNSSQTNNWDYLYDIPLTNGSFLWNVYACDGSGNCRFASNNRTLNIDTKDVNITIKSPGSGPYNTKEILINLTVSSGFADKIWWNIGSSNNSYTNPLLYNFSEGWNSFAAFVNDSLNNVVSATEEFYVKLTTPIINQVVPTNNKETTSNVITFRANVTERKYAMDTCKLYVDDSLKGTNITPERSNTNFSVNYLGVNDLTFDTRIDSNDLPTVFANTRTFTHNNTSYTYTEYLSLEQGAIQFQVSSTEEDFADKVYLSTDASKIKYLIEINETFNWSEVNTTQPMYLIMLGETLNITNISATNITVYTRNITEIYKDGDSAEIFAEPASENDADWLWDINMTSNGTLNYIGLTNSIDRTDLDCDEDDERCSLRPGQLIALPNDYAGILFNSISEERNDFTTIQVEVHNNSINLDDGSGNNRSNLAGLEFTTDSGNDDFIVGQNTTDRFYIVDNNSITEIWIKDGSLEYLTNATNFSINLGNESINVTLPQGPLTTNVGAMTNESQAFNIVFPGSGEGLWFYVDVDNDFFGANDSEEANELRYSATNSFGGSIGIGVRDYDQMFNYGAVIEEPKVTFGSGSIFDLEIPSQRVYADVQIVEMNPDISFASVSLTVGTYDWYITCNNTENTFANSSKYNLDIVASSTSNDDSSSSTSSKNPSTTLSLDDDEQPVKKEVKKQVPEVETPDPTIKKTQKISAIFDNVFETDAELMTTLKKIFGDSYFSKEMIAKIKESSEKLNETLEIDRDIETGNGVTKVILSIQNKGENNIKNLIIDDVVPKEFSEFAKDIVVEAIGAKIEILKEDPEFLIVFPELKPNDLVNIEYRLSEEKDANIVNSFNVNVYAEEIEQEEEINIEPQSLTTTFIVIIVLSLIIAIIVLFLFHKKNNEKGNKKQKKGSNEYINLHDTINSFLKK